jgi:hypothetical protein
MSRMKVNADRSSCAKPTESNTVTSMSHLRPAAAPDKTYHSFVTGKSGAIC